MLEGGGLDPSIPKIYNTWGLWWIVSQLWPPAWSRVGVVHALEEMISDRHTHRQSDLLSPLALQAGSEKI